MNTKQLTTALTVTSQHWLAWNVGSTETNLTFTKLQDNDYGVLLHGSNVETASYPAPLVCVSIKIGKRGGITKKIQRFGLF
jgi:hypothetical protein